MATNSIARSLHDVGLAAWFGGSLMGAVGVNGAAREVGDEREATRIADVGWDKFAPFQAAAVGANLIGGVLLTGANKGRMGAQRGVATTAATKAGITGAALAASLLARREGERLAQRSPEDPQYRSAARRLQVLQWVVPALTGALVVLTAQMGEQQRPSSVVAGIAERLSPA